MPPYRLASTRLSPLFLVATCLIASPAFAEKSHVVPMSFVGDHPRIEIMVEGVERPLSFVVDTAAGGSVIDASLATRLGLIDQKRTVGQVQGAGGAASGARVTGILSLSAGEFQWKAQMLAIDLSHIANKGTPPIDGILGNDLMTRFDTRFDLSAGQLTLAPKGSLPRSHCIANSLSTRSPALQRFAFVPATLRDGDRIVEATAVVDTGAAQTVLNRVAAKALGLADDDTRLRLRESGTQGLSTHAVDTWLYTLPHMTINGEALPAGEIRISPLPVFATLGLEATPALILGVDALRDRPIGILAGAEMVCLGSKSSALAP